MTTRSTVNMSRRSAYSPAIDDPMMVLMHELFQVADFVVSDLLSNGLDVAGVDVYPVQENNGTMPQVQIQLRGDWTSESIAAVATDVLRLTGTEGTNRVGGSLTNVRGLTADGHSVYLYGRQDTACTCGASA